MTDTETLKRLRHAVAVCTGTPPGEKIPNDDTLIDRLRDQKMTLQSYRIKELEAEVKRIKELAVTEEP